MATKRPSSHESASSGTRWHPGRVRAALRWELHPFGSVSLPLIFLAGVLFEGFFLLQEFELAALVLNVLTLVCVAFWAGACLRDHALFFCHPVLVTGNCMLFLGAALCLFGLLPLQGLLVAAVLKTLGTVQILFSLDRMERKRMLEILDDSQEHLESVIESIPEPVFILSPTRTIIAGNQVALAAFGEKVLGRTCCETYLDHKDCSSCTVTEVLSKGKPRHEIVRAENGTRRFEVTTFPLIGKKGFAGKLIQQIRDVSAQSEVEDRASLLFDVVNSVRDPVLTLDLKGILKHKNRAAATLVGIDPLGASALNASELLPFKNESDREFFLKAVTNFEPWEREVTLIGAEGDERSAILSLAPIRSIDDRLLGTVVIVRDVTEVKRLQAQLLENEKLGAVGELVSGVAHELNNPLTAVFGYAQILLSEDLPRETLDEVRYIYINAERCKKIIDGLLKFARRHHAEKSPSNLNDVVNGALELLNYQLRLSNVKVVLRLANNLPLSLMDGFQMQQVLINLITNSHHAIQERGVPGLIKITTERGAGHNLALIVEDNGIGIPPEIIHKIFDPFFTTKGIGKGTGLGLSLCYGIIKDHGGVLRAASRHGEGTTMRLELPIVESAHEVIVPPREEEHADAPPCRILVLDDEPVILELLTQILHSQAHEVVTTTSVDGALREVERENFDAIFSDWRMPGKDGEEFYEELLRRHPSYRGRVVFITGDSLDADVVKFADRHRNQVIHKPFSIKSLNQVLARLSKAKAALIPT